MQEEALIELTNHIKAWGKSLGFQQVGIADVDVSAHKTALLDWIDKGYHGQMSFFERNIEKRLAPDKLLPGTLRAISVRMDYLPEDANFASTLADPNAAYISRYAMGRDYHKVIRKRLKQLAQKIDTYCQSAVGDQLQYRPFVDSAPVLEHAIAEKAGIGWTGKHSLTLNKDAGSWFFLGELFINLPLPIDTPVEAACGSCTACISICPTNAIVAPYTVDARKCISYLTIEHEGIIADEYREAMGNRIYGCDDCQLACPYNREAEPSTESDFTPRAAFKDVSLLELFSWTESTFLSNTEGTAIRRIGINKWRRNISIAIGNAPYAKSYIDTLEEALKNEQDETLIHHYEWALTQQRHKRHIAEPRSIDVQIVGQDASAKHLTRGKGVVNAAQVNKAKRQQARLVRIIKKGLPRDA